MEVETVVTSRAGPRNSPKPKPRNRTHPPIKTPIKTNQKPLETDNIPQGSIPRHREVITTLTTVRLRVIPFRFIGFFLLRGFLPERIERFSGRLHSEKKKRVEFRSFGDPSTKHANVGVTGTISRPIFFSLSLNDNGVLLPSGGGDLHHDSTHVDLPLCQRR